jgi:hypothetical protein
MKCPQCGLELDSNGLIMWCSSGHVYTIESPEYPCDDDEDARGEEK